MRPGIPEGLPRIGFARHLRSVLLALLNDEVGAVTLDDALDLWPLVSGDDEEASRLGTDCLVLGQGHLDQLCTVGSAALACETEWSLGALELFGDLGDPLVDLAIEGLVAGETSLFGRHGGNLKVVPARDKVRSQRNGHVFGNRREWGPSVTLAEDVFRDANERIAEKALEFELEQPIPFLCECSDRRCFDRLFLMLGDYEEARSDPERYLTVVGHEVTGAMVIAEGTGFVLAEKIWLA
jgi:hypothetical protein